MAADDQGDEVSVPASYINIFDHPDFDLSAIMAGSLQTQGSLAPPPEAAVPEEVSSPVSVESGSPNFTKTAGNSASDKEN